MQNNPEKNYFQIATFKATDKHSRHTVATLAITAGTDISAVKEMLGHSSVTSTEVYAKVSLDKKIQAVNLTDGVFG